MKCIYYVSKYSYNLCSLTIIYVQYKTISCLNVRLDFTIGLEMWEFDLSEVIDSLWRWEIILNVDIGNIKTFYTIM